MCVYVCVFAYVYVCDMYYELNRGHCGNCISITHRTVSMLVKDFLSLENFTLSVRKSKNTTPFLRHPLDIVACVCARLFVGMGICGYVCV